MKSLIEDPLEFARQTVSNNFKTLIYEPRHCDFCNRLFLPLRNYDIRSVRNFCQVCYELLYPNGGELIYNSYDYNRVPNRKTPIHTKETMWKYRIQLYKDITHHEFPYHKKFKYFEESESRLKEAESVYRELIEMRRQANERERVEKSSVTCHVCGDIFLRKSANNIICPKCKWFFGSDTTTLMRELATGKCTRRKVKQLLKDKLEDLDEDIRNRIIKGEFDFAAEVRTLSTINRERAEILENLEKHKIVEDPVVRCNRCGKVLTSKIDLERKTCQACSDSMMPPEVRWFKGIVGLSNRSLEDIAKLPRYCHEVYTKHMSKEELEQFRIILAPIEKQSTLRSVAQERFKFTNGNCDI